MLTPSSSTTDATAVQRYSASSPPGMLLMVIGEGPLALTRRNALRQAPPPPPPPRGAGPTVKAAPRRAASAHVARAQGCCGLALPTHRPTSLAIPFPSMSASKGERQPPIAKSQSKSQNTHLSAPSQQGELPAGACRAIHWKDDCDGAHGATENKHGPRSTLCTASPTRRAAGSAAAAPGAAAAAATAGPPPPPQLSTWTVRPCRTAPAWRHEAARSAERLVAGRYACGAGRAGLTDHRLSSVACCSHAGGARGLGRLVAGSAASSRERKLRDRRSGQALRREASPASSWQRGPIRTACRVPRTSGSAATPAEGQGKKQTCRHMLLNGVADPLRMAGSAGCQARRGQGDGAKASQGAGRDKALGLLSLSPGGGRASRKKQA